MEDEEQSRHELLQYFERVEGMLDSATFEDEESKELFLGNVLEEIKGKEKRLACDLHCSRVLEKFISQALPETLSTLLAALAPDFPDLLCNRYGSHVLQAAISAIHRLDANESTSEETNGEDHLEHVESIRKYFLDLTQHLLDNLDESMRETYSSHVFRSVILCLAGLSLPTKMRAKSSRGYRDANNQRDSSTTKAHPVPHQYSVCLDGAIKSIVEDSQLCDWIYHRTAGPCLQAFLKASAAVKNESCESLSKAILGTFNADNAMAAAVCDATASHVIDVCLELGSEEIIHDIFAGGFQGDLLDRAGHGISNFVLQKLLQKAAVNDVSKMADELCDNIEDVLAEAKASVVAELINAAARCQTRQEQVLKGLATAFHFDWVENVEEAALCLLSVSTLERWKELQATEEGDKLHVRFTAIGCQLVRALANMDAEYNQHIVMSLSRRSSEELLAMACHKNGSFALQALFTSSAVGSKRKANLISKLEGGFVRLASNSFGSHIVDAAWSAATIKAKTAIANELVAAESQVKSAPQGKFIWRNCKLDVFKHHRDEWWVVLVHAGIETFDSEV